MDSFSLVPHFKLEGFRSIFRSLIDFQAQFMLEISISPTFGQHLPPLGVLLSRGVKTLAHLKAGNQSVTS